MRRSSHTTSKDEPMNFVLGSWLGLFWLLAAPLTVLGSEQAAVEGLLGRMAEAVRQLDYQGTFVYLQDDQLEAMHIMHVQTPQGERERLISLNGSAREVVREGETVTCILPENDSVLVDERHPQTRFPGILPQQLSELTAHYGLRLLGQDRVAGREAVVVGIIPRDHYRYGYRLYVDQETALPLKSDLMDENGRPLEQIMFTQLEVAQESAPVPASSRVQDEAAETSDSAGTAESETELSPAMLRWEFRGLPQGFVIRAHEMHGDARDIEHYVISDGLASLSVFVEAPGADQGLEGESRMGAINASGGRVEGFQVTVVGEVPLLTVRKVMQGLKQAGTSDR